MNEAKVLEAYSLWYVSVIRTHIEPNFEAHNSPLYCCKIFSGHISQMANLSKFLLGLPFHKSDSYSVSKLAMKMI